jgi:hypothetical protein
MAIEHPLSSCSELQGEKRKERREKRERVESEQIRGEKTPRQQMRESFVEKKN